MSKTKNRQFEKDEFEDIEVKDEYMDTIEKGFPIPLFAIWLLEITLFLLIIYQHWDKIKVLIKLINQG